MLVTLKSTKGDAKGETIVREPIDARELVATGEWEVVEVDPKAEGPVTENADGHLKSATNPEDAKKEKAKGVKDAKAAKARGE